MGGARISAVWGQRGQSQGQGGSNRALCPWHLATWGPVGAPVTRLGAVLQDWGNPELSYNLQHFMNAK